ncbi:MAG: hypothetical protein KDD69_19045 [Bdellovibrionales bacterium]|nr:hypothetical protein [Bdellovibrionales bacterium]
MKIESQKLPTAVQTPPGVQGLEQPRQPGFAQTIERLANDFSAEVGRGRQAAESLRQQLPPDIRPYIETQMLLQRVHLGVQLLGAAAQAATSGVRSLQQAGGN